MNVKIYVTAQSLENYSDTNIPYWKPKGPMQFVIEDVNSEIILYARKSDIVSVITKQLAMESNQMCKYTYISHEVVFSEAKICGVDFSNSLTSLMSI